MIEKLENDSELSSIIEKMNEIIDILNTSEKTKTPRVNPYDKNNVKSTYNKPKIRKQNK